MFKPQTNANKSRVCATTMVHIVLRERTVKIKQMKPIVWVLSWTMCRLANGVALFVRFFSAPTHLWQWCTQLIVRPFLRTALPLLMVMGVSQKHLGRNVAVILNPVKRYVVVDWKVMMGIVFGTPLHRHVMWYYVNQPLLPILMNNAN